MRARNREVNIFNISMLDILTGMLGAFLFLMLGLVPYYTRVIQSKLITPEEQQQFENLKKLLDQGAKGPLTQEQIQQLRDQLDDLQKQVAGLQGRNQQLQEQADQLQNDLDNAKQDLKKSNEDRDFWEAQQGTISVIGTWDSTKTDVDLFIRAPNGKIYGAKKEKLFGREVLSDGSDSHGSTWAANDEGILAFMVESGDYLIFYRIPQNAVPGTYAGLRGWIMYHATIVDGEKKSARIVELSLGSTPSGNAKPGGTYAWATINYDSAKQSISSPKFEFGRQLPDGIQPPPLASSTPPPSLPMPTRQTPGPSEDRKAWLEKFRQQRQQASPSATP